VAPLYLLACLILGGSAQGVWQSAILQLVGLAIIAWAASSSSVERLPTSVTALLMLGLVAVLVVALQSVPMPPSIWAKDARERIAEGYGLLGQPVPALPISLTPYASLSTLLCLIPPLAMFCAVAVLPAGRASRLAAALIAGTLASVVLGVLQVASTDPAASPWYLYSETIFGSAVGFFANANHMAILLVMALPFTAAIASAAKGASAQRYSALLSMLSGTALILVVGIVLNGSLAGYALALPVLVLSALIFLKRSNPVRPWLGIAAALSFVAGLGIMASSAIGASKVGQDASISVQSRQQIFATTSKAVSDYFPLGSGLGSFPKIYRLYETPDLVTEVYVIHAHNDYLELALELGVAGVVLIAAFLLWWLVALWATWRIGEGTAFTRAASIASAAVLVHSAVDFPLRTAAISATFAMCLALLANRRQPLKQETADLRPARHIVIR